MKGSRVQAVVQELRGEKIDIVPYSEEIATFVCNAIAPAEVARVLIDEKNETIELVVPDDQLSLAIGRRGQNVRLASQLVGWKVDINSESKVDELKDELRVFLSKHLSSFTSSQMEVMFKLGFHSAENIVNADAIELTGIPDLGNDAAEALQDICEDLLEARIDGSLWGPGGRDAAVARLQAATPAPAQTSDTNGETAGTATADTAEVKEQLAATE